MENTNRLLIVNGETLPTPSSYNVSVSTLVESHRNTGGHTIGEVVRNGIRRIDVTWTFLSVEDWGKILRMFNEEQGGNFVQDVAFFCPEISNYDSTDMYVSDRGSTVHRFKDGSPTGWLECNLTLIEV